MRRITGKGSIVNADDDGPAARQNVELIALRRMIVASEGNFSLSFALCHDALLRDSLIQRLGEDLPNLAVVSLNAHTLDVLEAVQAQTSVAQSIDALFVLGLENSIPYGHPEQPTLRILNNSRERWEKLRCPVVFWLPEYAHTLLAQFAPDFWRYRSHQFDFIVERTDFTKAMSESTSGYDLVDSLSYEEKLFRASELEQRLKDVGSHPSPDLTGSAIRWSQELAGLLGHQGRWDEAKQRLENAILWASPSGEDSLGTMTLLNSQAILLKARGDLAAAEPLYRRVLKVLERQRGPEHPDTLLSLNNLGSLLYTRGQLSKAEPLYRRALAGLERQLGPEHPDTLRTVNNLALLLYAKGDLAGAEPLFNRALDARERNLGSEHPDTLGSLNNLAMLLDAKGDLVGAEQLFRRALEGYERKLGPEHPHTLLSLNNLGAVQEAKGDLQQAREYYERAVAGARKLLLPDHPWRQLWEGNLEHVKQLMMAEE